jgi:hypothetical protein
VSNVVPMYADGEGDGEGEVTGLWLCRWPGGMISIAIGFDKQEAIDVLAEECGAPEPEWLEPYVADAFYANYEPIKRKSGDFDWGGGEIPSFVSDELMRVSNPEVAFQKWHGRTVGDPMAHDPDDDHLDKQMHDLMDYCRRYRRAAAVGTAPPKERELWLEVSKHLSDAVETLSKLLNVNELTLVPGGLP